MTILNNESVFNHYINQDYPYKFSHGPDLVRSRDDARNGLNCIALAHMVLKDMFGKDLPGYMKCYETFTNDQQFENVARIEDAQAGDLVWFGVANPKISLDQFVPEYKGDVLVNWADFPIEHVGVFTGEFNEDGQHLILHASKYERTKPAKWTIAQFKEKPEYSEIYGIQRLKDTSLESQAKMVQTLQLAWQFSA